jgi:hypothetical protein
MKLIFCLAFVIISNTIAAQVAIGLYAGFDQSKFSGDLPRNFSYEFKTGYVAGLTVDLAVAEKMFISLRPNFTQNGANISVSSNQAIIGPLSVDPLDTTYLFPITNQYIAMPIVFQIYVSRAFYANSGIDLSYNLSAVADIFGSETDLSEEINVFLISAIFGFGFSIPIRRTSINLEFSYAQGLNTLTNRQDIEDGIAPRLRNTRFRLATYFIIFASKKTL